ncbi:hypothetical protein [Haloferax volcanii]|uniref:hypothetical protein n=1 Tax=Haloferax volcanii TaxID=2246 RepID=UPI001BFFD7A0|nr:hypothetical protein [Haloferax volcanii]MDW7538260.1 hypothetical protein [Haloferax volcanii]
MSGDGTLGNEGSDRGGYAAPEGSPKSPGEKGAAPFVPLRDAPVPWADEPNAMEKSLLLKTAVLHPDVTPEGIPFHALLTEVYGDGWASGGPEYGRAYRFIQRYGDFFDTRKPSGDLLWVRPTGKAVALIRSIRNSGTPGSAPDATDRWDRLPRDRAASVLRSVRRVETDGQRSLLLHLLADHAETMLTAEGEAKTLHLPDRDGLPAGDRFTAPEKAAGTRERFETAADALTTRYDVASWVTLTLPRECVPSVYGSVETLREALDDLHSRFRYSRADRPRPGHVPDYLAVLEPQRDLVAHLHVVYGGEERVMAREDLRADWADLLDAPPGKPPQVDVRTLSLSPTEWSVAAVDGEDVDAYPGVREYHREGFRALARLAEMEPDALRGLADDLANGFRQDEGRPLAGLALPFATEARLTTTARALPTT